MDKAKIFLEDGIEKLVNCLFYLYNSKYYFLYTENEKDENGYVRLYLVKVGKETTNTSTGIIETGNMVGIEIPTDDEWKEVQGSISKIVNSKKTKTEDKDIQYLPIDMLVNLKVVSKKTFKLLASIIENDFGVSLDKEVNEADNEIVETPIDENNVEIGADVKDMPIETSEKSEDIKPQPEEQTEMNKVITEQQDNEQTELKNESLDISTLSPEEKDEDIKPLEDVESGNNDDFYSQDIIIDYRTKFFEEQEKNKRLNEKIEKLEEKLKHIDEIIKED